MRIASLDVRPYRLPLRRPFHVSSGSVEEREGFIIELCDEDGVRGCGEAAPVHWTGAEPVEAAASALAQLQRQVAGGFDFEFGRLSELCSTSRSAACAVDTALCDLAARRKGVSVAEYLGGKAPLPQRIASLAFGDVPLELARDVAGLCAAGYRTVKIKVGARSLEEDIKRVTESARALSEMVCLRLDANRAWSLEEARRFLEAVAGLPIDFIEEPLSPACGESGWRNLAASSPIRLAADESIEEEDSLSLWLTEELCDVVVLKLGRVGGPHAGRALAEKAIAAGREVVFTDSIETDLGQLAALHTAAACSVRCGETGLGGARLMEGPMSGGSGSGGAGVIGPVFDFGGVGLRGGLGDLGSPDDGTAGSGQC